MNGREVLLFDDSKAQKRYTFSRQIKYFVNFYYFAFIFLFYYVIIEGVNAKTALFSKENADFLRKNNFYEEIL